ncbi:MAG: FliM/FliN family flagellar motor switch protein [Deferrisomatales bacterium]|nr:FliM/FliN family flagellar motor switch protein [Deferrisomatales bacterium]
MADMLSQEEIDRLLARSTPSPGARPATPTATPATPGKGKQGAGAAASDREIPNIDLILDIEVDVMVRLGETVMPLREVQALGPGSVIALDKDTDTPVELVVNDRVVAKGELVVTGSDHFALRVTEIETPSERIRTLGP